MHEDPLSEQVTMKVGSIVMLGVGTLAFALAVRATLEVLQDSERVGQTSASGPVGNRGRSALNLKSRL